MHKHWLRKLSIIVGTLSLAGCGGIGAVKDGPPARSVNVANIPNARPRPLPRSRYGNPKSYVINGKRYYVLASAKGYNKRGIASWYGTKFHGRLTSSREPYDMFAMTAASPNLPIPTFVRVTNLENGRSIIVKVNDRGPFAANRIIDLSYVAAKKLGYTNTGTALVQVTAITPGQPAPDTRLYAKNKRLPLGHNPRIYLQLGAFSSYGNAEALAQKIQRVTARHVMIKPTRVNHRELYRVQVGPLVGVGETDALKAKLDRQGFGEAITVIT